MSLNVSMNQGNCNGSTDDNGDWPLEEDDWLRDDSWNNSEWPTEDDWGHGTFGNSHFNNLLEQIDDMHNIYIVKSIKSILLFSYYKKIQYFFHKWVENKKTLLYLSELIEEKSKCVEIESMLINERITCANLSLKLLEKNKFRIYHKI